MTKRPETMPETDAVELLVHQHEEIRRLLQEVENKKGDARAEAFERLCRFLAVHETAEEEVVHPVARRSLKDGEKVIDARLEEENEAKKMLQALEKMGPSAQGFDALFAELRKAVLEHAEREEREEFAELRTHTSQELRVMAVAIKAAQAIAPTHPHPGVETPTKHMLVGSFAAVADRTRDVVRKAMRRDNG
jgi:magnesium-transporting ATPase (P-type)